MIGMDWIADEPVPMTATRLPEKIDALVRPAAGEVHVAGERVGAGDVDLLGHGEAAGCHDVEPAAQLLALRSMQPPPLLAVVPHRLFDAAAERHVAAQVEPIGHVLRVPEDLRLRGVLLAPHPRLVELGVERIRVVDTWRRRSAPPGSGSNTRCRRRRRRLRRPGR